MSKLDDFIRLVDIAIAKADALATSVAGTANEWMATDAGTMKVQLERIKNEAIAGSLSPSMGAGLGLSRALGEWAPDDLYEAGVAVENFYRQHL